jgi:DNA repair protein RecO (recombination protein O)
VPPIKDEAIVLRRLDYSETSQVLVLFTREHGPRRLIAKGVKRGTRKKFAVGIDLLERGTVVFIAGGSGGQSLGTLTEWRQCDAYLGLRQELTRLYAAQYVAGLTAGMTEEADPHPELYDALARTLSELSASADVLPFVASYQCDLLESTGLWPDLHRCVMCDKPAPAYRAAYFSAHQGGLVCRDCEPALVEKRRIPAAVLTALRERRFDDPAATTGAFDLLDYTIAHATGKPTRLADALRKAAGRISGR